MPLRRVLRGAALVLAIRAGAASAQDPEPIDARALYLVHCASCHGPDGDGRGTAVLDRPARSFRDGGFSFGNTPEALYRTVTSGIPGTPMPSFEGALSERERRAIAAHVATLGPPPDAAEASGLLVIEDRPVFVRGKLPPLADGGPPLARGLLVGTPDGFSFEYAADDVAPRAVRHGAFVRRRDWQGRGGSALEPLGVLVDARAAGAWLAELDAAGARRPLRCALSSTSALPDGPRLAYRALDASGARRLAIEERISAARPDAARVAIRRELSVENGERAVVVALDPCSGGSWEPVTERSTSRRTVREVASGATWTVSADRAVRDRPGVAAALELAPREVARFEIVLVVPSAAAVAAPPAGSSATPGAAGGGR